MKKRYKLESGMDTSITLEIDTDKIPEETARGINAFWIEGDYILDISDGDAFQAVRPASSAKRDIDRSVRGRAPRKGLK